MKRIIYPLLLSAFSSFSALAQEPTMFVRYIKVLDGFTQEALTEARVSIMEKDSVTLVGDSLEAWFINNKYIGHQGTVPRRNHVVIRVECKGYPTEFREWKIPERYAKNPDEQVRYAGKDIDLWPELDQNLGEAQVNASRILMVMKGDTIEYNAAAFRMHEGSMLDNLVRALPGVNLDDNGRITVNGEFVKSLLVNGRDFFDGDPKIALRNLPAYTVNKVKVYRKSDKRKYRGDDAPLSEEEKRQDPLVMDVMLKREYEQGWISNYEVGGGTTLKAPVDERWMARLFALRYTNHSSIGIYAAANNTNDGATPGDKGEWTRKDATSGEKKSYLAGVTFSLQPKNKKLQFNTSLKAQREEELFESSTIGETFYNDLLTHYTSQSANKRTSTDLNWNAHIYNPDSRGFSSANATAYYRHNKRKGNSEYVSEQAQGGSALDTLYQRTMWSNERETAWGTSVSLFRSNYLRKRQTLDFYLKFSYNKHDADRNLFDRLAYKMEPHRNLTEQRRYVLPSFDYNYGGSVTFDAGTKYFGDFSIRSASIVNYEQTFKSGHQDLSRSNDDGLAPSAAALTWVIDELNSYHTTRMERNATVEQKFNLRFKDFGLNAAAELPVSSRRISDYRNQTDEEMKKTQVVCNARLNPFWGKNNHSVDLIGTIMNRLPELSYLIDRNDSSDPLWHDAGNPSLKTSREYSLEAVYRFRERNDYMRSIEVSGGYSEWENNFSFGRFYNPETGVTTVRPMNINGTWRAWAKGNYSRLLGKAKRWNISNDLGFSFDHSLDYVSDREAASPIKSAVDNLNVTDHFRVDYRINEMRLGAKADLTWRKQKSLDGRFATNSFTHFNYGVTLSTPLIWGIHFGTDIMAYYRRGYTDASMNTTDWVWNAELSRPLGRRKQWLIKAIGFDLLQQIPNVRREVNNQGWQETRYNTKPSYVMLHVVYRLDVKPKKSPMSKK